MPDRTETRIAVRTLVEFLLRSGDIDNRTYSGPDTDAMLQGGRIHRKIQKSMPDTYHAEVPLKAVFEEDGLVLVLYGRADGIVREKRTENGRETEHITVDEIKGIYGDVYRLLEPREVHLAQAKCYAAMLVLSEGTFGAAAQADTEADTGTETETDTDTETDIGTGTETDAVRYRIREVTCQLTYCSFETEELRYFQETFGAEELVSWLRDLVHRYFRFALFLRDHRVMRDRTAGELPFPYPWRKGQKAAAAAVYRAVRDEKDLFLQAPTGIGKTLAVLYPSIKAFSEGLAERIFYLTAKNAARKVAEDAFRILAGKGLKIRTCSIRAKEKACLNGVFSCDPESCSYARGHFDRVNEALYALLKETDVIDQEAVGMFSKTYRVCPYELALDAAEWCDAVIADYNYCFDPEASLSRFLSGTPDRRNIFLVDEAHNLPSRARDMYSGTLRKDEVLALFRRTKLTALNRLNRALLLLKRTVYLPAAGTERTPRTGTERVLLPDGQAELLLPILQQSVTALSGYLEEHKAFPDRDTVLSGFFSLRSFLDTAEHKDSRYRVYLGESRDGGFYVRYFCIDPSGRLKEYLDRSRSTVFFSATLLPVRYYKELLTGSPDGDAVYAEGPFRDGQKRLFIAGDVSSRFTKRNASEYGRIADYIRRMAEGRPGNYLCFFPSYRFLAEVEEALRAAYPKEIQPREMLSGGGKAPRNEAAAGKPKLRILPQRQDMTEEERAAFLEEFRDRAEYAGVKEQEPKEQNKERETEPEPQVSLVGLCVLGGAFSEGIDLPGERLIGVAVAGTGLQAFNADDDLIRDYYAAEGKNGFDFAYRFPGMCRVLQAAGRLIRTEEDRGVILLLDDRFLEDAQLRLFPKEWGKFTSVLPDTFSAELSAFWAEQERERRQDMERN